VLGAAMILAVCSCGQAMRSTQPVSVHSSFVDASSGGEARAASARLKTDPAAAAGSGAALDPARSILAQLPSLHSDEEAGALQPIVAQQMLEQAIVRYEAARKYWDQGELTQARGATDLAFRSLMLVPSDLDQEQAARRDEVQLQLARLVVTMSAAHAGPLGVNTEIPLVMNQYVERELRSFQTSERAFFVESYRRAGRFLPFIRQRLQQAHMPQELAWLPLIESGFTTRALSPKRALGLWQFIPSTGYRFGLQRDVWVDERMDPILATDAALAYLKELHQLFGDWSTAVAAYNCGEANVAQAIRRQRVDYLDSFWDLFPILPYETARYVPRFMATLQILSDPEKYGFDDLGEPDPAWDYETVEISLRADLRRLASLLEVDAGSLVELNPALRRGATPPRAYPLRVPAGVGAVLAAKLAETPTPEPLLAAGKQALADEPGSPTRYRVRQGDTLSSIARRFRVSVASIVRANSLMSQHRLSVGQLLNIPRRGV
jgi:membrane-bound lytic murein transglycosylase D